MRKAIALGTALCVAVCRAGSATLPIVREQWTLPTEEAKVVDGTLVLDGRSAPTYAFYNAGTYGDVSLEARYSVEKTDGVMAVGFVIGSADSETFLRVHYDRWSAILYANAQGGAFKEIKRIRNKPQAAGTWYTARLVRRGKTLEVFFNGKKLYDAEVSDTPGRVGFYASQTVGTVKDIRLDGTRVPLARPWRNMEEGRIHGAPKEQARAEIIWTRAICKEAEKYIGWPTICRRKSGELLAVFSGDRKYHVCPWGKVQLVRSFDGGETWSAPETVCNTVNDDRDAGIMELANGDLLVTWFSSLCYAGNFPVKGRFAKPGSEHYMWQRHFEKLPRTLVREQLGYFTRRSTDGGKTWEPPVRTTGSANHGGIQLKDGRLLMVGRRWNSQGNFLPEDATAKEEHELTVDESTDNGRSWHQIASIHPDEDIRQFHEPHLVEAADGTIVAQFRCHIDFNLRQSESTDGGKTWTPVHRLDIHGHPPHLIRLADDKLVTVYGVRDGAFGEYACISDDNGKTWDVKNQIKLAGHWCGDLGYPASVQLPDGSIITVYYQAEKIGEKTCLMATRWRVK